MKYFLFASLLIFSFNTFSQEITGKWITIDEDSKKEKSVVEIYEEDGKYFGKIIEFLEDGADPDDTCQHCKGKMKGKKLMGFKVLRNFEKDGNEYVNGEIIDPENDKTYEGKIWVDEDDASILNLRGYVSIVYKTIQWKRAED